MPTRTKREMWPGFGSVSTATMRTEDLLSAFAPYCEAYGGRQGKKLAREADSLPSDSDLWTDEQQETAEGILSEMFDNLDAICPPYVYFGAHEGDGADYGFWSAWDSLEDSCRSGEVLKVTDLSAIPAGYVGEVLEVNDHGNATLYWSYRPNQYGHLRQIWACV